MPINSYQAKQIPMADFLGALGIRPEFEKKQELWYLSPFRQESAPSFKVNIARNIWYDFGEGEGGTILDFVMKYRKLGSLSEALEELGAYAQGRSLQPILPRIPELEPRKIEPATPPEATVKRLHNRALVGYLQGRGISMAIAADHLQEIHYTREGKNYFALAFPNDAGGYEMRNAYFKGTHGAKDVTLLPSEESICTGRRVAVFEGFIDFLSALALELLSQPRPAVLVLNSNALKDRAVAAIRKLETTTSGVDLYLDHDKSGRELAGYFKQALAGFDVADCSGTYLGHKDVNERLTGTQKVATR